MSEKPRGALIRLPISEADARRIRDAIDTPSYEPGRLSDTLLATGTPVTGSEWDAVCSIDEDILRDIRELDEDDEEYVTDMIFKPNPNPEGVDTVPLVRQSDAQAQIAALEAEVVRLRTELTNSKRENFNAGYLIACCNIYNMHNEEGIAANILRDAGITETEVKDLDLSEYDAEALAVIRSAGNDDPILKGGAA